MGQQSTVGRPGVLVAFDTCGGARAKTGWRRAYQAGRWWRPGLRRRHRCLLQCRRRPFFAVNGIGNGEGNDRPSPGRSTGVSGAGGVIGPPSIATGQQRGGSLCVLRE